IGPPRLDLAQQRQPVNPRHIDVRKDDDELGTDPIRQRIERLLSRGGKMQDVGALPRFPAKVLAKHFGDVGLVVDNQDAYAHQVIPVVATGRERGRRMVNSVNSPSWLSTSIEPPCCCVTMSQLIERPRPVPSPVGLVVKNGWKSLSRNSGGIPVPLSLTRISTAPPRLRVVTFSTGRKPLSTSRRRLSAA